MQNKESANISIVFLDVSTIGEVENLEMIASLGELTTYSTTSPEETITRMAGNQVVITNKVRIDKKVMDACPDLKLICIAATGMNNIDLEYARQLGIEVKNVSGYSTESVAQSTFAMLFNLLNKTTYFDAYVKSGQYSKSPIFTHHGKSFWEIKGKQFGIIGLGTIGKRVAEIATVFGSRVVYYSTSGVNSNKTYQQVSLEEILTASDIISIHCPLNEKTENLIHLERLKLLKPNAILLNAGRGKIINEADLAYALNYNLLAGAGIDVFASEPIEKDNPLLNITDSSKLILTPHIAWISTEAREELVQGIYRNIQEWQNKAM